MCYDCGARPGRRVSRARKGLFEQPRVIAKVGRTPLSAKLKSARLQAGLTQQQLADRVHCSRTAIADYERGRSEPDAERLAAIAKATNVPLSYFLDAPVLLDGEPVQVLTPAQLLDLQCSRPGPPRSGGWTMVRPEHWCDRLGAIIWVEVEPESALAEVYEPGSVLAVAHTNAIFGCRVIVAVNGQLAVGQLIERGRKWRVVTPSGEIISPAARNLIGSVVARIEPAAAMILSHRPRTRKRKRRIRPSTQRAPKTPQGDGVERATE